MQFVRFVGRNARWLAGGFLLTFFSSFGQTFFVSLSNGDIRREYDLSNGGFGLIYMAATLASAATLPFVGWVMDRYAASRVAFVTIVCLAGATVSMALSQNIVLLVVTIYLLRLFGQGMMTEIAQTATGRWFAANRGRAMAIATLGSQTGSGIFPLIFVSAAAALGWRGTWIAAALILLLVALPVVVKLTAVERDPRSEAPTHGLDAVRDWTKAEVVRSPTFYLIAMAVLAPPFIGTTLFFHQVYLTDLRGWSMELFASGFALMSLTTVGFSLLCGTLIDRFTAVRMLPFFLVPLAFCCLIVANVGAPAWIFVFMFLLGISNGLSSTLLGSLWPEIYGTRHLGDIRSVIVALMVLASALGPGITGVLIDWKVSYPLQINVMGFYCVVMTGVMILLTRRLAKQGRAGLTSHEAGQFNETRTIDRIDPQPQRR